eukprot:scaffold2642_cov120-Cylindrotheca_fusiformis.AAC.11
MSFLDILVLETGQDVVRIYFDPYDTVHRIRTWSGRRALNVLFCPILILEVALRRASNTNPTCSNSDELLKYSVEALEGDPCSIYI